ncbi:MAG: hypothetical protein FWH38_02885 [Treponema sp.]|nr:hypothetical protein [Treponema sp.]
MKNFICAALCAAMLLLCKGTLSAERAVPFFGNNNFTIDINTIFSADINDGSTGLQTIADVGLWFEYLPYTDRNIAPQRDVLSVSLKLANSASFAWRGYGNVDKAYDGMVDVASYMQPDQIFGIWFDTFIAQLEYNRYWIRIAGIEPEVTISQASIKSVMDPLINNRTASDKNSLPLPLLFSGGHYNGAGGVVSVISRDLVHLNRREVEIAGNMSAGMKTEIFDLALKAGSWKIAGENFGNSWVGGGDFSWRPDLVNLINFSFLGAVNYGTVTLREGYANQGSVDDPMADPGALAENPFALGLGYEYRINLPRRMVIKPYAGIDFIWETRSGENNFEIGGGLQWFFRGTGAEFKRNTGIGGIKLGDVKIPAAFIAGMNADKNGIVNAVISFNEDPQLSPVPNFGGFLQVELMNIGRKEYAAPDGNTYGDFLCAGMVQLEYRVNGRIMPYLFGRFMPGYYDQAVPGYKLDPDSPPVIGRDYKTVTSKLGCRFTPFRHFSVDVWYERSDLENRGNWAKDNGLLSVNLGISL